MRKSKPKLDSAIKAHYESGVETDRLLKGTSRLEFYRTKQIISRYLPPKPARVLDIGGGPGFYARWLAEMGHEVHLVDPIPLHVKQTREAEGQSTQRLASISQGDARALDFADGYADAILMLGPLYHLVEKKDREKALFEAVRVLKPRGVLFAAAVSRFTSALDGSFRGFIRDSCFMKIVERDLKDGQHRNPTNKPEYWTTAFFHHPDELHVELREAGFDPVKILGVTGFGELLPNFEELWGNEESKKRLLTILERTETEITLLGSSTHLLGVAWKRGKNTDARPDKEGKGPFREAHSGWVNGEQSSRTGERV